MQEYTFERVSKQRLRDIKLLYKECFEEEVQMDFLEKNIIRKFSVQIILVI